MIDLGETPVKLRNLINLFSYKFCILQNLKGIPNQTKTETYRTIRSVNKIRTGNIMWESRECLVSDKLLNCLIHRVAAQNIPISLKLKMSSARCWPNRFLSLLRNFPFYIISNFCLFPFIFICPPTKKHHWPNFQAFYINQTSLTYILINFRSLLCVSPPYSIFSSMFFFLFLSRF